MDNYRKSDHRALTDRFTELVIDQIGDNLVSVVLYGSVARGDAGPESDIDILLVLDEGSASYYERLQPVLAVLGTMTKEYTAGKREITDLPPEISALVLTRVEASENRYLFLDMIADAQFLFDRDEFFENRLKSLAARLEELGSKKVHFGDSWYWDLKPDLKLGERFSL